MINAYTDVAERQRDCMYCSEPIHKGDQCLKIVTQNYKGGSAHGDCFQRYAIEQNSLLKRIANRTSPSIPNCSICNAAFDAGEPHLDFCPHFLDDRIDNYENTGKAAA